MENALNSHLRLTLVISPQTVPFPCSPLCLLNPHPSLLPFPPPPCLPHLTSFYYSIHNSHFALLSSLPSAIPQLYVFYLFLHPYLNSLLPQHPIPPTVCPLPLLLPCLFPVTSPSPSKPQILILHSCLNPCLNPVPRLFLHPSLFLSTPLTCPDTDGLMSLHPFAPPRLHPHLVRVPPPPLHQSC